MKTRTQQVATGAFAQVTSVKKQSDTMQKDYRTVALSFPAMVLQAGLTQAIGFLMAKNEKHHQLYLEHIAFLVIGNDQYDVLHRKVIDSDVGVYQQLTRQTLDAASWLKRYTQAQLPKPGKEGKA